MKIISESYISWAIPHKDCATDASSNFSSDETKSGVNTWCIHEHFCEIWESVSYLTYADCVVRFFERWREKRRKSFVDFRVFSRNISENMHARCVREDTKQALKGNLQADGVQSRQTLFVRYCLNRTLPLPVPVHLSSQLPAPATPVPCRGTAYASARGSFRSPAPTAVSGARLPFHTLPQRSYT